MCLLHRVRAQCRINLPYCLGMVVFAGFDQLLFSQRAVFGRSCNFVAQLPRISGFSPSRRFIRYFCLFCNWVSGLWYGVSVQSILILRPADNMCLAVLGGWQELAVSTVRFIVGSDRFVELPWAICNRHYHVRSFFAFPLSRSSYLGVRSTQFSWYIGLGAAYFIY